jgi:uncharacterized membrane protein HdeD (DUF308 family)
MKYLFERATLMFLVSGLVTMLQGIIICIWQDSGLSTLIYLFGFSIIIQGLMQFVYGTTRSLEFPWIIVLYLGVINIAAGHFIIFFSRLTEFVFILTVGVTWASNGIVLLLLGVYIRRETHKGAWLILSGIVSIAASFFALMNSHKGLVTLLWGTVLYDFLFGVAMLLFGIRAGARHRIYFDDIME